MSENFPQTEPIEKFADVTRLVEIAQEEEHLNTEVISPVDAHSELQASLNSPDEYAHLDITPQQFMREKSGKYKPSIRPNFWVPVILLFANLIPFICFGTAFVFIKEVQLLPVHNMTDPTNPIKVIKLLAFFTYISIPSMVGTLMAILLLKIGGRRKILSIGAWILVVALVSAGQIFCFMEY